MIPGNLPSQLETLPNGPELHPQQGGCLACRQAASRQGRDSFLMGPSGFGFTHPSAIAQEEPIRQTLVNLTAHAASSLDMAAYVHWDEYNNDVSEFESQKEDSMRSSVPPLHGLSLGKASALSNGTQDQHPGLSYSGGRNTGMDVEELYSGAEQDTLAMEKYIAQFANTSIRAVFSPITPYVHKLVGDVVTFRELIRWTNSAAVAPSVIAQTLTKLPKGSMGYVYKLPDITMHEVEVLGRALQGSHVKLIGHREMINLAGQSKQLLEKNLTRH